MTVNDLRSRLAGMNGECVVVVELSERVIGPTAASGIDDVSQGFDWDSGRVILTPSHLLVVAAQEARTPSDTG